MPDTPFKLQDPRDIIDFLRQNTAISRETFIEEASTEQADHLHRWLLENKKRIYDEARQISGLEWAFGSADELIEELMRAMSNREIREIMLAYRNIYDNVKADVPDPQTIKQWKKDTLLLGAINIKAAIKDAFGKKGKASSNLRQKILDKKRQGLPLTDKEKAAVKSRFGSGLQKAGSIAGRAASTVGMGVLAVAGAGLAPSKSGRALLGAAALVGAGVRSIVGAGRSRSSSVDAGSHDFSSGLDSVSDTETSSRTGRSRSSSEQDNTNTELLKEILNELKTQGKRGEEATKEGKKQATKLEKILGKTQESSGGGGGGFDLNFLGGGMMGKMLLASGVAAIAAFAGKKILELLSQFISPEELEKLFKPVKDAAMGVADAIYQSFANVVYDKFGINLPGRKLQHDPENEKKHWASRADADEELKNKGFNETPKSEEEYQKLLEEKKNIGDQWNPRKKDDTDPNSKGDYYHRQIERRLEDWERKKESGAKNVTPETAPQFVTKETYEKMLQIKEQQKNKWSPTTNASHAQIQQIIEKYEKQVIDKTQPPMPAPAPEPKDTSPKGIYESLKGQVDQLKEKKEWKPETNEGHRQIQKSLEMYESKAINTPPTNKVPAPSVTPPTNKVPAPAVTPPKSDTLPSPSDLNKYETVKKLVDDLKIKEEWKPETNPGHRELQNLLDTYEKKMPQALQAPPVPFTDKIPDPKQYRLADNLDLPPPPPFEPTPEGPSGEKAKNIKDMMDKLFDASIEQRKEEGTPKPLSIVNAPSTAVNVQNRYGGSMNPINSDKSLQSAMGYS